MNHNELRERLAALIPETDDILFNHEGKARCSRQAIVNLLSSQDTSKSDTKREEIKEKLDSMKKETCDCDKDEDPQALGYHTKDCDMRPYGYNQALEDIKKLLEESA
jgi:hypothetical protein